MIKKGIKFGLLTLLSYLFQASVAGYIAIGGVAPNIALAMISIVSVGMGRKYTFFMSVAIGYLLEIMLPALSYINMILYPVCAMLGALAFSDKSERRMEEERSLGRRGNNLPAHVRTILCALVSIIVFEFVHVFYIYLSGIELNVARFERVFISIIYTTLMAAILQFPVRWWMGIYKLKKAR